MNRSRSRVGVDVQEGEVALAQRDEVAAGAQVGLDRDRPAVARDGEAQVGLGAGCGVAVVRRTRRPSTVGARRGARQRPRAQPRRRRARSPASVCGRAVDARSRRRRGRRRRRASVSGTVHVPSARCVGCRCWKPVMSRRTTIRCMRFVCSTSKSRTVRPRRSAIRKARSMRSPGARGRRASSSVRPPSLTARPRTVCGARRPRRRGRRRPRPSRPSRPERLAGVDVDAAAGERGGRRRRARGRRRSRRCGAELTPSPARRPRVRPWPAVYSAGRSSIAPSIASEHRDVLEDHQRADVLDQRPPRAARWPRTSAGTSRPTSPCSPASRGRGSASSRPSGRSSSPPWEEHQGGRLVVARASGRGVAHRAGIPRTAMPANIATTISR